MTAPRSLPLPSLRQLEYLVAVADEGGFGRAAARCHVSQPGLSTQLREVESLLGVRLFERDRRGVVVTPAGEEAVARARAVLASARDLVEAVRGRARPLSGTLRAGVIPTVAPWMLPRCLPRVRREYPGLRLRLVEDKTDNLLEAVARGRLDVALLAIDVPLGDADTAFLFDDPFVLAMPPGHRLASRRQVTEKDLDGERVLLLDDGHCLREQARAICARSGAAEDTDLRATSLATLVPMVAGGEGVTLLPAMAADGAAGVVTRPFRAPAPARRIGLAWRRGSSRGDEFRLLAASLAAGYAGR